MSDIKAKIIDLIERNRISSTEVADALGKSGVLDGIDILCAGKFVVGEVDYVYGYDESNWPIHVQVQDIDEGKILYVDTFNCNNKAAFGDLVSKYLLLYKKVKGIVVNGLMRDNHTLQKEKFPVWCKGVTPLGCFNRDIPVSDETKAAADKNRLAMQGGIMVCDDTGCTLIAPERITEDTFNRLELIEMQEDIWFYCLDTLKWSTYEIVCEKKYLKNKDLLPAHLRDKLTNINLEG